MATRAGILSDVSGRWLALWILLAIAVAWFLYDSFVYVATREPQAGATFLNRQLWYYAHMVIAVPILLIAPLQFLAGLRKARPTVHRRLGQFFLAASIIAGLLAVWLGATLDLEGSRVPLALFGVVWIGFSAAAWVCAVKRDYVNHRKFVIRSFVIGLAFVWVRVLGALDQQLFFFIANDDVRDTTGEYLSFVLPLLAAELWLSWAPAVRSALRRR